MRKFVLIITLAIFAFCKADAQRTLTFWTDETTTGKITVYYNGNYVGTITKSYTRFPGCYASGCVTVTVKGRGNTYEAFAEDGTHWSSDATTLDAECTGMRLHGHTNSSSNSGGYGGSNNNSGPRPEPPGLGEGAIVVLGVFAAAAVVVGEVFLNSDLYIAAPLSYNYSGLEFGFRNNWNDHITFEQTVVWHYELPMPMQFLNNDSPFHKRSDWGCNARLIYNFFERDKFWNYDQCILNPYVGFGADYMQQEGFFTTAVAGFTFGNERVKMDCRYTFGYDFRNKTIPVNQIQLGLVITYQLRRFGIFK